MEIHVFAIGKSNDLVINQLIGRYEKRISRYQKLHYHTIDEAMSDRKTKKLFSKIMINAYIITLTEKGKRLNSLEFSKFLYSQSMMSYRRILFFIGGPYGLSSQFEQKSHYDLSLSAMTFTHQMCRVLLLEQIYRAHTIFNNHPYHHG
ncbi:MAG: 23S rRNA (pseudouridine(1915)-N(3))-methyltransferase RlmH [Flavobacteriaceae bacterium]|nr:23S rRNA (pseudouridine(1915)-N(3))-methyltransferase RlmH [Flavobacteriaceae bacterium]